MARKLFLILALFLLVGSLTAQLSDEDGIILSELYNSPAEELGAAEALARVKRGFLSRLFKKGFGKIKKIFRGRGGGEAGGAEQEAPQE